MEATESVRPPLGDMRFTLDASAKPLSYFITTLLVIVFAYSMRGSKLDLPSVNSRGRFELTAVQPKKRYLTSARDMIYTWFKANPNKPVKLISDIGETIVLPPSMANEIKNDSRLSFMKFSADFFQTTTPGFDAFHEGTRESISLVVINKDLTKSLAKVTEPLADEATLALKDILGVSKEWRSIHLRETMHHFIARISSRVFLGDQLCRNEAWLEITKGYTMNGFASADRLREWPRILRPIVHWFLPGCQKARSQLVEAARILKPVLAERCALRAAAAAEGREPPFFNDAIDWFEQASKGAHYDPAISQLFLSSVAIHTTTDLLNAVLTDIAKNPEILEPLRREILTVLKQGGWQKTSLYSMKLLDSVVKETQRLKPLQLASMQRKSLADITLSDGTFIPKDTCVYVSSHVHLDPDVYQEPEKWIGDRFLRLREQPGKENVAQLVSTSPEHLGFGHGKHACPGRFFAANEIKIALVHLVLQYDWRLPDGAQPFVFDYGINPMLNPDLQLEFRRREEEVDLQF
ncbi:Cytochrome P450 monooxygenase TRI1 [Colletotrichum orbiculare MAFF 240422]|uniref:Cytochrome P450 monooxygenase TRI1 n=1 Tax=Colletotrichum orbiculare (strain 104-T / ATCC 96160 / CBS 514.97 / LARS 414 / MAFF 240422) TaxID=1213857 RepID=N4VTF3_COLOR|nr:Cytochrome P450 monooxygenase TRI1 [Colletotrichum orbiculare MAFF 240422]